jgi:hypothetical protein
MKKSLLILSAIVFLFGCKKEKKDFRDNLIGNYKGSAYYVNIEYGTDDGTVRVTKDENSEDRIILADITFTSQVTYDTASVYEGEGFQIDHGYFNNDSLNFEMLNQQGYVKSVYRLKKQ